MPDILTLDDARQKFIWHQINAKKRRVLFLLTFEQWYQIWEDSGHWEERGSGKNQFVMARFGDQGPYAMGNVKIVTREQNSGEQAPTYGMLGKRHSEKTRNKMSSSMMGNQNGRGGLGRIHSAATRSKISATKKGRPWSKARRIAEQARKINV